MENRETMREHNIQNIAHFSYYTNANGLLLVVLKKRGSVNTPPPLTVSRERSESKSKGLKWQQATPLVITRAQPLRRRPREGDNQGRSKRPFVRPYRLYRGISKEVSAILQ